ncbi:MAG: ATP-binding cassette domain-containing protein [Clostridiales bacterium]|nr:ATP-binding cassette domain-containing protein [Clostridiales bacterium]
MIELRNVSKIYTTGERALEDVTLTVEEGDIFGIVGKSGAGKSTMLKLMGLLEMPTTGEVVIFGENAGAYRGAKANAIKKNIGTVFQGFNLLMQRSVAGNIAFPLEITGKRRHEIKTRCEELAELVGLSDKLRAYPASLSGGQKQRVAIARALATNPKILLCDEPTSALDSFTAKEILRLIKDINAKLGMTTVIITHDIHVVKAVCNRMAVVDEAHIVEIGKTAEILANPQSAKTKELLNFDI